MQHFLRTFLNFYAILSIVTCQAQAAVATDTVKEQQGSGIASIDCDSSKVRTLAKLGMLWGFIKYYHARVNRGDFDMDAELFDVLPKVIAPGTDADKVMEEWVDHFGLPKSCADCTPVNDTTNAILMPDYGYLFDTGYFPASLINKLDYIRENRLTRKDHHYVERFQGVNNPIFNHEEDYGDMPYPDAGIRLLALYRFWNIVQYFFPSRHLMGLDWNKALAELIPRFCNAKDTVAYHNACAYMITLIHDSHARMYEPKAQRNSRGINGLPLYTIIADHKIVIVRVKDTLDLRQKLHAGDAIEKINGVPVDTAFARNYDFSMSSNYTGALYFLMGYFLFRTNDTAMNLEILRDGKTYTVTIPAFNPMNILYNFRTGISDVGYKMLDGNIGYIYPGKLEHSDLHAVKKLMKDTKGIIIDMRCYPNTFMPFTYCAWLKKGESPFVLFTETDIDIPGKIKRGKQISNGCAGDDCYNGKLVIIVNHLTMSQAEYTVMALAGPNTTVIGDTTQGADGNVSWITLPGNIRTALSGLGVYYPDGTQTQRVGIKIDKIVRATIKGVTEDRDELLEAAISSIK